MLRKPYLTKSTFVSAVKCGKWLWNNFHNRQGITPSAVGSSADIGNRVGKLAHQLFPNDVEINKAPWQYALNRPGFVGG